MSKKTAKKVLFTGFLIFMGLAYLIGIFRIALLHESEKFETTAGLIEIREAHAHVGHALEENEAPPEKKSTKIFGLQTESFYLLLNYTHFVIILGGLAFLAIGMLFLKFCNKESLKNAIVILPYPLIIIYLMGHWISAYDINTGETILGISNLVIGVITAYMISYSIYGIWFAGQAQSTGEDVTEYLPGLN